MLFIFSTQSVNSTSVADSESCFPALVSKMCCSIVLKGVMLSVIMMNVVMLLVDILSVLETLYPLIGTSDHLKKDFGRIKMLFFYA
jgi:hypothetical protein